jgi:ABC-type transport system substrate-binding protein
MKTVFALVVLIFAVAACGCTATAQQAPPAPDPARATAVAIPGLTGTWTGPMQGYDEGTGFTGYPFLEISMTVTEQHGRIFAGYFTFRENSTETRSGFAGAIGRDGATLAIAEQGGGYCSGTVVGDNEIELVYLQDGSPYSAAIDSFRRASGTG